MRINGEDLFSSPFFYLPRSVFIYAPKQKKRLSHRINAFLFVVQNL